MRKRYIVIWGVIALLPVAIFAIVEGVLFYRELHRSSRLQFQQVAHSAIYAVDQTVLGLSSVLTALSTLPALDQGDGRAFTAHARELMAVYPEWLEIAVVSPETGKVFQRVQRDAGSPMSAAISLSALLPLGADPYVSNLVTPADGDTGAYILIAVPVPAADGSPERLLMGTVVAQTFAEGLGAQNLPSGWGLSLRDRNFRLIAKTGAGREPLKAPLIRDALDNPGAFHAIAGDNGSGTTYVAHSRSSLTGWELVLTTPEAPFFEVTNRTSVILVISGAIALLATIVLTYFLITLIRRAEETAREAAQKDMLLREVNHRVKNSLQMVASILRLQQSKADAPEAKQHLIEAGSRINLIAKVHSRFYRDRQPDRTEIARFLKDLCRDLEKGLAARGPRVLLCEAEEGLYLPTERAISLIMIAHELISNAFKYAPDSETLKVTVSLRRDDDYLVLEVTDTGPGLATDFDPRTHAGLGFRIVDSLVHQLGGDLTIARRANPTVITVRLPSEGLTD